MSPLSRLVSDQLLMVTDLAKEASFPVCVFSRLWTLKFQQYPLKRVGHCVPVARPNSLLGFSA